MATPKSKNKNSYIVKELSLSKRDSIIFINTLFNPAPTNENLKSAFDKYKRIFD